MTKCKAVVFDADGTLYDTFELIVSAYRHVAETHNLHVPSSSEVRVQLGKALPDIFRHFYPDENIQALLETNNTYVAANTMNSEAFAGVGELLQDLTSKGLKLAILTGGSSKVHDVLKHHKFDSYFTSVVHHERVMRPKPNAEGFLLACRECGSKPEETVMVGDTTADIGTGKNGHALATIAVTHGFGAIEDIKRAQPDFIATDIFEVDKILSGLIH